MHGLLVHMITEQIDSHARHHSWEIKSRCLFQQSVDSHGITVVDCTVVLTAFNHLSDTQFHS
jgi:hypothetical protein